MEAPTITITQTSASTPVPGHYPIGKTTYEITWPSMPEVNGRPLGAKLHSRKEARTYARHLAYRLGGAKVVEVDFR